MTLADQLALAREWQDLGERLARIDPERLERLLLHMREVVEAQEEIVQITSRPGWPLSGLAHEGEGTN